MKKSFVFLLLINISIFIFASDYNIATTLVLNSKEYTNILNNENASTLSSNIYESEFDETDMNNLKFITKLCNTYLNKIKLPKYYIDQKFQESKKEKARVLIDKLINYTTLYSTNLDQSNLQNIEKIKQQIIDIEKNEDIELFSKTNNFNFVFSEIESNALLGLLLHNDNKLIISNILEDYSKDGLLLLTFSTINDLKRFRIEYLDTIKRDLIYDKILTTEFIREDSKEILTSLIKYFNDDYSILTLSNKSKSVQIYEIVGISKQRLEKEQENKFNSIVLRVKDLSQLDINNEYLVLENGIHYIKISNSYTTFIKKVEIVDKNNVLDIQIEAPVVSSINLISKIGLVNFKLNGIPINTASSFNLQNQQIPFYIEATKESFMPFVIQNTSDLTNIEFSLKPLWMGDNKLVAQAQSEFYSSLFTYILINFASLSINNINDAFGSNSLDPFIDVFSTSVVSLSSLNTIYKLISYIKLATI
jgi:hypothetical protein